MIGRDAHIRAAWRSRQRGFLLNPFRFGGGGPAIPSGYIASAAAGMGSAAAQRSSIRTDLPTWEANFGGTISEGLFASALTVGGNTGAVGPKTLTNFSMAKTWRIQGVNNYYINDLVTLRAEFLNASGAVVAAFEIARPANFTQSMGYGASLSSLTLAPTAGSSPQVNGTLSFDAAGMYFTPISTSSGVQAWSRAGDFASVTAVRFSNLRAYSSSPADGGYAYITVFRNP